MTASYLWTDLELNQFLWLIVIVVIFRGWQFQLKDVISDGPGLIVIIM
jgi:hypothetical protein